MKEIFKPVIGYGGKEFIYEHRLLQKAEIGNGCRSCSYLMFKEDKEIV